MWQWITTLVNWYVLKAYMGPLGWFWALSEGVSFPDDWPTDGGLDWLVDGTSCDVLGVVVSDCVVVLAEAEESGSWLVEVDGIGSSSSVVSIGDVEVSAGWPSEADGSWFSVSPLWMK